MGKTKKDESASSSDGSAEAAPAKKVGVPVKSSAAPTKTSPAVKKAAPPKKASSSSSSSSGEEEVAKKPAVKKAGETDKATPAKADAKKGTVGSAKKEEKKPSTSPTPSSATKKQEAPKKKASSSSSSSSSEEKKSEEKVKPAKKAAAPPAAAKKKEASSSGEGSESSSDEGAKKPAQSDKKRKADGPAAGGDGSPAKKPRTEGNSAPEAGVRVFVGNLPFTIDDEQIRAAFADCGEIVDIHWVTDKQTGKFYGNGFLEFESSAAAQAALKLAGTDLGGRPMKVDMAQPKREAGAAAGGAKKAFGAMGKGGDVKPPGEKPDGCTTVFLGNLSFQIDEPTIRTLFADCGTITAIRWVERDGQFKGCGFVEFEESDATDKAVAKNGQDVLGRAMRVDFSAPRPPRQ